MPKFIVQCVSLALHVALYILGHLSNRELTSPPRLSRFERFSLSVRYFSYFLNSCALQLANLALPCKLCLFLEFLVTPDTPCRTALARDNERTFGLMILSTKELKNPTANPYNNQSEFRGFLTASVRKLIIF